MEDPIDPAVAARLDTLAERLVDVSAELDDVMFDVLRRASVDGSDRPAIDRELQKVRRSIEKAVNLLGSIAS
ncbi:MAG: hypothetical protein EBR65_00845 [Actinobacteria bacterium]|jgi:hypothetical protein|nr:hypothetical protein [Actinomycetota bacterium]